MKKKIKKSISKTFNGKNIKKYNIFGDLISYITLNNSNVVEYELINEYKYDDRQNRIYTKTTVGSKIEEVLYDFDNLNNCIHHNSNGYEIWNKYDNKKLIETRDRIGTIKTYEYNEDGNIIHCKDSTGLEYFNEYDSNGNIIKTTYPNTNRIVEFEYDEHGHLIHYKSKEKEEFYEYSNDNLIFYKFILDGEEYFKSFTYNENNDVIYSLSSDGIFETTEYEYYPE